MKRWPLRIVLCLLLGAMTTVGMAWAWAAFGHQTGAVTANSSNDIWSRRRSSIMPPSPTESLSRRFCGGNAVFAFGSDVGVDAQNGTIKYWNGTVWVQDAPAAAIPNARTWEVSWISAGWPWPALEGGVWRLHASDGSGQLVGTDYTDAAIALPSERFSPIGQGVFPTRRVLPLWPVALGFILDSLAWGCAWLTLSLLAHFVRRARRKSRGRCPECQYDLRGNPSAGCPECGWNREP